MSKDTQSIKRTLSDSSSLSSVKKSCDEKVSVFGHVNNFFKYHIVWYNERHENPLDYYNISSKFRQGVLDYLECFIDINTCQKYIQSLSDGTVSIIVIISVFNASSMQLIDNHGPLDSLHSIYIHQEGIDPSSFVEIDIESSKRYETHPIKTEVRS